MALKKTITKPKPKMQVMSGADAIAAAEQSANIVAEFRSNPLLFAETFLHNPVDTSKPFKARWMQIAILGKTSKLRNTVRAQRSSGKTIALAARILWHAYTKENSTVLVIAGFKMHVQRVFEALNKQIDASEFLGAAVVRRRNNPFEILLDNGSLIRGQSTNVTSKKGGQAVRGEHPTFIYVDEADYLEDEDWNAFTSLMTPTEADAEPPEVWATTTPTGKRSYFYKLCTAKQDGAIGSFWQDWWYPARHIEGITFQHPTGRALTEKDFSRDAQGFPVPSKEMQILCTAVNTSWTKEKDRLEYVSAGGQQGYYHEIIAWFGDSVSSVFPKGVVDKASQQAIDGRYTYITSRSQSCGGKFVLGADVDKSAATPNVNVIEYIPTPGSPTGTGGLYVVRLRKEMDRTDALYGDFQDELVRLNSCFGFEHAYIDKQPGDFVVENLNMKFGLSQFEARQFKQNAPIFNPTTNQVDQKPLKHVMIQIAQRLFEEGRVVLAPVSMNETTLVKNRDGSETVLRNQPEWDADFEKDLRNFSVINVTKTGTPEYTCTKDHRIMAFILALWCAFEHFDNPYEISLPSEVFTTSHDAVSIFNPRPMNQPTFGMPKTNYNDTAPVERDYQRQSTDEFRQTMSLRRPSQANFKRRSF